MTNVKLSTPARPEFIHVMRSVVAGVAARLDFAYDDIEDLRLAVDEACAYLLEQCDPDGQLHLEIAPGTTSVEILARVEGDGARQLAEPRQSLFWYIVGALTDEARLETSESGPAIRFVKRLPERTP